MARETRRLSNMPAAPLDAPARILAELGINCNRGNGRE
jgi:hypothetical protein